MFERGRVFLGINNPRLSAVLLASSGITDMNTIDELYTATAKGGPESRRQD